MSKYSDSSIFQATSLYASLAKQPFGFIDAGAAGGVHPLIQPLSDLTACTGFEPDPVAYCELVKFAEESPFSRFRVFDVALSGKPAEQPLYLTKSNVCISLLQPDEELPNRYGLHSLDLVGTSKVKTDTLDNLFNKNDEIYAEFIKLDCQGIEFEILHGAENILKNQCVALYVEAEFFTFYKGQKLFHEIDGYLRGLGFQLYGLSPHYLSAKKIDRRQYDTQERIAWADAVYFKDPLAYDSNISLDKRKIESLIVSAIMLKYYDFSIELVERFYANDPQDKALIIEFIQDLALSDRRAVEMELQVLISGATASPDKAYLLARKFIDRYKANCDFDNISL